MNLFKRFKRLVRDS